MGLHTQHLDAIGTSHERMVRLVTELAEINSGTRNAAGVARVAEAVAVELERAGGVAPSLVGVPHLRTIDMNGDVVESPLGPALRAIKRPDAPLRVLLCIHLDTVYGADHPFQHTTRLDPDTLRGPGVADAKGGIVVLLAALEAFEQSPWAERLGWEVLLTPDEEIGSPGSAVLLKEAARRNHLGLLFEPAQADGALVSARKGSGNFTAVVHGRSAHAGRDPLLGRNAVHAMADFVTGVRALEQIGPGVTANVGQIAGGVAFNVIPDRAVCRFNVRVETRNQQGDVERHLVELVGDINDRDGFRVELHGGFHCPPKPLDAPTTRLLEHVKHCGQELGLGLMWRPSGGASDGNKLAAAGLPNVDTLGPRGGNLHSAEEFVRLDSLAERAKLTALLMMKLAAGEVAWQ